MPLDSWRPGESADPASARVCEPISSCLLSGVCHPRGNVKLSQECFPETSLQLISPDWVCIFCNSTRSDQHNDDDNAQDEDGSTVLVNNKCKCARITSRIIPSPEDPTQDIVERNIRITLPLNTRENISDPTSPLRTKFVYHLSDLCKKCDPTEVELGNQMFTVTQSNICDEDSETCYAYDRNKCYTNKVPLLYGGKTIMVETALTPESCYSD